MPVTKRVLMRAFCDVCKATMECTVDKGGVQDMVNIARDAGWRVGNGGYTALCPACVEKRKNAYYKTTGGRVVGEK